MGSLNFCVVFIGTLFVLTEVVHSYRMVGASRVEPLFLTPYLERGDISGGQRAARAESLLSDNIESYSGLFTVNKTFNSNMFFWFFPAEKDNANAPFIVWLIGGPGVSSIYAIFEYGVYNLTKNEQLSKRDLYLSQKFNMLYIDNPIGTGFSFTEQDEGYSKSATDFGQNLYSTVQQFFQLFPQYRKNDFYIGGTSYAGKYVPALAYTIDINQNVQNENNKINLKGLMIGNGFSDPASIINRSELLYNTGLIGNKFKIKLDSYINRIISLINQSRFLEAMDVNEVMRKEMTEQTGYTSLYNLLSDTSEYPFGDVAKFINSTNVKKRINVGNRPFETNEKLFVYIRNEIFQTVKPWVEKLLEKYNLLMYSGQLDLEVPYSLNSNYLQSLNWSGAEQFKNAERKHWFIDEKLVGYKQTGGRLSEVLIRNAGHGVQIDKPKELFELFNNFIYNNKN